MLLPHFKADNVAFAAGLSKVWLYVALMNNTVIVYNKVILVLELLSGKLEFALARLEEHAVS